MARTALTLVLSAFTLLLVGCGGSPFEGQWTVDKEEFKKTALAQLEKEMGAEADESFQEMADGMAEAMQMTVDIKKDGTFSASISMFGMTDTQTGTWKASGNKATLTMDDDADESATAVIRGKNLILTMPEGGADGGPEEMPFVRVQKK